MIELSELLTRINHINNIVHLWRVDVDKEFKKLWDINSIPPNLFSEKLKEYAMTAVSKVPSDPREEAFDFLDQICQVYCGASLEDRNKIRQVFSNNQDLLRLVYEYIGTKSNNLRETGEIKQLQLALAAASIEDQRIDSRDLQISLGYLYIAAIGKGIEPVGQFQEIAGISSDESSQGAQALSTRALLSQFHKSLYFRSSVQPHLRKDITQI